MSKWIGESEKLVRTMFAVAGHREPSVVFIDEVDSLLSQRSSDENEASRRLKTEFLVQLEGVGSGDAGNRERVLVVGATNRPQELDEAARRRFVKRFYVPLPDAAARRELLRTLLRANSHSLTDGELDGAIVDRTAGFSGADVRNLCQEAAMGPMRDVGGALFASQGADVQIPPIAMAHFEAALATTRATVSPNDLVGYEDWNAQSLLPASLALSSPSSTARAARAGSAPPGPRPRVASLFRARRGRPRTGRGTARASSTFSRTPRGPSRGPCSARAGPRP